MKKFSEEFKMENGKKKKKAQVPESANGKIRRDTALRRRFETGCSSETACVYEIHSSIHFYKYCLTLLRLDYIVLGLILNYIIL